MRSLRVTCINIRDNDPPVNRMLDRRRDKSRDYQKVQVSGNTDARDVFVDASACK